MLGAKYIEFLVAKLKLMTQFKDCIEGSYAPGLQTSGSTAKSPTSPELLGALFALWRLLLDLQLLAIDPPKWVWNIRLAIALVVAREEYSLVALVSHVLRAYKVLNAVPESKESPQVLFKGFFPNFFSYYGYAYRYFNTLKLIPELAGRKLKLLPIGLDAYLNTFVADALKDGELVGLFQGDNEIMGLGVPVSAKGKILAVPNSKKEEKKENPKVQVEEIIKVANPIVVVQKEAPKQSIQKHENKESEYLSAALASFPQAKLQEHLSRIKVSTQSTEHTPIASQNQQRILTASQPTIPPQAAQQAVPQLYPYNTQNGKPTEQSSAMPVRAEEQTVMKQAGTADTGKKEMESMVQSVDLLGLDDDLISSSPSTDPHKTSHSSGSEKAQYRSDNSKAKAFTSISTPTMAVQKTAEELKQSDFSGFAFVNNNPMGMGTPRVMEQPQQLPVNAGGPKPLANVVTEEINNFRSSFFIDISEIKMVERIGSGASADVYRSLYRGTEIAVKVLRNLNENDMEKVNELRRELNALLILRHPNLVLFMGTTISPKGSIGLVTEFCSGGNLFSLLHESPVSLSWKQRCKIALDIAKGMNSLHSYKPPILHRDLKSLNLLLVEAVKGPSDPVLVKITDLGLARFQSATQYMTGMAGTFHWMAPEVLAGRPYTIKADVYSYAVVLWEIITRKKPYEGMDPRKIMNVVLNLNQRPDQSCVPPDCPPLVLFRPH